MASVWPLLGVQVVWGPGRHLQGHPSAGLTEETRAKDPRLANSRESKGPENTAGSIGNLDTGLRHLGSHLPVSPQTQALRFSPMETEAAKWEKCFQIFIQQKTYILNM